MPTPLTDADKVIRNDTGKAIAAAIEALAAPEADHVSYDNTSSGLTADNAQDAIDELKTKNDTKMDKADPTGSGALSLNRASGSTVGTRSVAVGYAGTASGNYSYAEGQSAISSGQASHSEGRETQATANYSHAEGYKCIASGQRSHAEGTDTTASGSYSHAEGNGTKATADQSHAEGYKTEANGNVSHAAGFGTVANHRSQFVFGEYNVVDPSSATISQKGTYVEIVGNGNDTNHSNARTLDWNGNETIAGVLTQSSDARLKVVNAEDIPDVSDIKAIRFNWKKNIGRDFSEHIGYLAQDVEKVLPFLVKEDAEGHKTLDYIAFLVAKIDGLEKRISELEKGE